MPCWRQPGRDANTIRRRLDKFLNAARLSELERVVGRDGIRMSDAIIETHNYCFHYLGAIREALRGRRDEIEPFRHLDDRIDT